MRLPTHSGRKPILAAPDGNAIRQASPGKLASLIRF
jgi:hypothetical protein